MKNIFALISLIMALTIAGCSDDFQAGEDGKAGKNLDAAVPDQTASNLPDGYGPLYGCTKVGQACNAHDPCAINPICGPDKKCRPSFLQDCSDSLACTVDKCLGQGLCSNDPKAGFCALPVKTGGSSDAGGGADAGASPDAALFSTVIKCFKKDERNPNDQCQICKPADNDSGGGDSKKWSPANGGSCDDKNLCTKDDYCQSGVCKGTYFGNLCADGYGCTEDLCDGKGGCLGNKLKPDYCLIDKVCYKKNASHPKGSCFTCDPSKSTTAWTPITNTCMINSKCYNKGAKNPGGCGECDPAVSTSKWTVKGNTCCLINDKSYNAGTKDTTGCSHCDPTKNKYGWTPLANLCLISSKCYTKGTKHPGGCAECDPVTSATQWTVKGTTHCLINQTTCVAKGVNDSTGCATCLPGTNKYDYTPISGKCKIEGKCYNNGTKHPGGCAECKAATKPTAWTLTSSKHCLINHQCYADQFKMGCFTCDVSKSQTDWTKPAGCTAMDLDIGTQYTTYGSMTRGFWFKAPVAFTIIGLRVPTNSAMGTGPQNIQVMRFPSAVPAWSTTTTNHTTLLFKKGVAGTNFISCNIHVKKGEFIGILGSRGTSSVKISYGKSGGYSSKIAGSPMTLTRLVYQTSIVTKQAGPVASEVNGNLGRIEMKYTP